MALATFTRLLAARRGATAMEFALVAVPLMMLMFASLEFGLAMRVKSTLQYATIEAARCSVVRPTLCGTEEAVAAFARTHMQGVGTSSITFTFTAEDCGRQVVGSMPFPVVAHSVMRTGLTLSAVACYPL
jgi:Flp pilus assembly protein TadG